MEPLPYIDEHSRAIDAPPDAVWSALLGVLERMSGGAAIARLLGCDPAERSAELSGRPGETIPGFRVVEAEPGRRLELRGRHHFANYALTFEYDGESLLARTHAEFPGLLGRIYRAVVIGSGGHGIATRHLLRQVARAA